MTWRGTPARMPRIEQQFLDCVVYLYENADQAKEGRQGGGCGFLLAVDLHAEEPLQARLRVPVPPRSVYPWFQYVVTCAHVAMKYPVVRFNRRNDEQGRTATVKPGPWCYHGSSDLAIAPLEIDQQIYQSLMIHYSALLPRLPESLEDDDELGTIGDDVFIVSRFIQHDGKQTNQPAVRFGNISVMPREDSPISLGRQVNVPTQERIQEQVAYLLEVRTIPGASGSPVFLHIPGWELREAPKGSLRRLEYQLSQRDCYTMEYAKRRIKSMKGKEMIPPEDLESPTPPYIRLLGVAGGYLFVPQERVMDSKGRDSSLRTVRNSGMEWCMPSWKVLELLNQPKLRVLRDAKRG